MTQFAKRDHRGAALADYHGSCARWLRAWRNSWGVRITAITAATVSPAPDTSRTFVRIGFDMDGRLLFDMQAHALFAVRDPHSFALDHPRQRKAILAD